MHLTSSPVDWYAARAAGIAAYLVLSTVVILGLALAGRAKTRTWPRFAIEDVHRFGGLLVGSLVTIHVLAIATDSYLPFSFAQLLVPFAARWRPLWTGLGVAAAELLLALAVTNKLRKRLPHRFWRRAHYLNFAVWTAATLHGIGSGTDRSAPWLVLLYAIAAGTVVALILWRVRIVPARVPRLVAPALGVGAVVAALALGPLRHEPHAWNAATFRESLSGHILRGGAPLKEIVSMNGAAGDDQKLLVRADLLLEPNRLDATSLQLEYLPSGQICRGEVTAVGSTSFAGRCRMPDGTARVVDASWTVGDDGSLAGTIHSHA